MSVSPDKREVVISDLKGVLMRFNSLKDLSAKQDVKGSVQRILRREVMLRKIEPGCLMANVGLEGGLVLV